MNVLKIDSTDDSPSIYLDAENLVFKIHGVSIPENANATFLPVIEWIDNYCNDIDTLKCEFFFQYLSSSTHTVLFHLLQKLEDLYKKGKNYSILWCYEKPDEDMLKTGINFSGILDIPFEFEPKD
ncbi:MAG: hypothetical protein DRJ01_05045 [Bacteroidetes bacterium]|nr:MAG: hypothetical protein DRJ01_05045 [Bacteroidota bacterium]